MKSLALCAMLVLVGCTSSRTYVASPMESEHNGVKYHYHNLVVLKDKASMFHVTESRSWMEYCKSKIESPKTQEEWDYPYQDCVMNSGYLANGAPSVAQQAVTPIVTTATGAAGFAFGMHELGKGIGKSGSRTTNNNSTSSDGGSSSASSESKASAKGTGGSATNNVNSGNSTVNKNHTINHNNQTTNINSNNHMGSKH